MGTISNLDPLSSGREDVQQFIAAFGKPRISVKNLSMLRYKQISAHSDDFKHSVRRKASKVSG